MKQILITAGLILMGLLSCKQNDPNTQQAGLFRGGQQQDLTRFEEEIKAFKEADKKSMPPAGAILFVGSSSIRMWPSLDSAFAPLPVIQRGFGGSTIPEVLHYADRIVWKYQPKVIVFYCGENDIAEGTDHTVVFQNFKKFVGEMEKKLPDAQLVVLSAKPSPARWELWKQFEKLNYMIQQFASQRKNVLYLNIGPTLLDSSGNPDKSLFVEDMLHMNRQGYARWERVLKPILLDLYQKAAVQ
ncbi:MAG: SGNH/GDSL hydrolase family protein [Saprospiraceae bacterium]